MCWKGGRRGGLVGGEVIELVCSHDGKSGKTVSYNSLINGRHGPYSIAQVSIQLHA